MATIIDQAAQNYSNAGGITPQITGYQNTPVTQVQGVSTAANGALTYGPDGSVQIYQNGQWIPFDQNSGAPTPTAPGYTNTNGTSSAQSAARAQGDAIKGHITDLAHSIINVYDTLYNPLNAAAGDQTGQVNAKYDAQGKDLSTQLEQDLGKVGASYAGAGTYDSSYRANAQDGVAGAYGSAQNQVGQNRAADLSKVGQFLASGKASLDKGKADASAWLDQINTLDPTDTYQMNTLQQLVSTAQAKLNEANTQQSQLGTQGGYVQQAQSVAPTGADNLAPLKTTLASIVNGAAAVPLKMSVGTKLIQNSAASPQEQQQLLQALQTQLNAQDTKQQG